MKKIKIKKPINFSDTKNKILMKSREIDLKEIVDALITKGAIDIINHPNQDRYPGQKIFIIELCEINYFVPYVESKQEIFLKTAFRCTKWANKFLKKQKEKIYE